MLNHEKANDKLATVTRMDIVPPANPGGRWVGVPHGKLITGVIRALKKAGHRPESNPPIHLSRGGADVVASIVVPGVPGAGLDPVTSPVLSLTSSTSGRRRLTWYAGVYQPGGAAVFAAWPGPRYDAHAQFVLENEILNAVKKWTAEIGVAAARIRELDENLVTAADARDLLGDAHAAGHLHKHCILMAMDDFTGANVQSVWALTRAFWRARATRTPIGMLDDLYGWYAGSRLIPT